MKVTMDDVLTLIDRVSGSNLTKFQFEDEDFSVMMVSSKKGKIIELNEEKTKENENEIEKTSTITKREQKVEEKEEINVEQEISSPSSSLNEKDLDQKVVCSPLVGTFYAAKEEGAEPFVKVGDSIKKGQVIGIVEAMKLMNEVESDYDGIVLEILVENEEMVEYNQPLIRIAKQ